MATTVNLAGMKTALGAPVPIVDGVAEFVYWAGRRPFIHVDGDTITFPVPVIVKLVDGQPAVPIILEPTGVECCVRALVRSKDGMFVFGPLYVEIPDTEDPVDFGDLTPVNPVSFAPTELTPTLLETIESVARDLLWDRF